MILWNSFCKSSSVNATIFYIVKIEKHVDVRLDSGSASNISIRRASVRQCDDCDNKPCSTKCRPQLLSYGYARVICAMSQRVHSRFSPQKQKLFFYQTNVSWSIWIRSIFANSQRIVYSQWSREHSKAVFEGICQICTKKIIKLMYCVCEAALVNQSGFLLIYSWILMISSSCRAEPQHFLCIIYFVIIIKPVIIISANPSTFCLHLNYFCR